MSKIIIVMVLYNKVWKETTLYELLKKQNEFTNEKIIIYDNSPVSQDIGDNFLNVEYYHDESNGMIEAAYNYAYKKALEYGYDWLFLLDQDMTVELDYLKKIKIEIKKIETDGKYVALVPKVKSHGQCISPSYVSKLGIVRPLNSELTSECGSKQVTGINSGTVLRVDFIKDIGGFNKMFKLDMLDHWYFSEIHKRNKKVCLIDYTLEHDLSVMNYNTGVSRERYAYLIEAENQFHKHYSKLGAREFYKIRLIVRFFKHLISVKDKEIAITTLKGVIRAFSIID